MIMTRLRYIAALAEAGLVVALAMGVGYGCAKMPGEDAGRGREGGMVFSASVVEPETRTMLGAKADGVYRVLWKTGDQISVNGVVSDNAVTALENGQRNVDFTVGGSLSAPYKVLYPGTTSENVVVLPAEQSYVANSFDGAAAASYGSAAFDGGKYSVRLTSFCGILRFALKGSATLSRMEINSLGSEKLYGSFTLGTDDDGFTGEFEGGTSGTLTYNCPVTLSSSDTYFYVAIPAQVYSSGIEALVYQADGAFMRLKFWGSGHTLAGSDLVEFESKTYAAGRTENIFGIDNLTAEDGGEPTATPPGITVAVFNINQQSNRTGNVQSDYISMDREDVQAAIGSTIAGLDADVIGFNSLGEDNLPGETHDIKAWAETAGFSSSNYTWSLNHPNKISEGFELITWTPGYKYSAEMDFANGFAYNNTTLELEAEDYIWICDKDDDYWSSMKSAYNNNTGKHTVVWARFRHKVSGYRFYLFVTHFATYPSDGKNLHNVNSFRIFAEHIKNDVEDLPIIGVGSLNFGPKELDPNSEETSFIDLPNYATLTSYWTDAYARIKTDGGLPSFYDTYCGTLTGSSDNYYYPFLKFTKNRPDRRVDYVVTKDSATQNLTPRTYKTVRRTYYVEANESTYCASNHFPLMVFVTFD